MKKLLAVACLLLSVSLKAQDANEKQIRQIYDFALTGSSSYSWLDHICNAIGPRLSGSANAEKAVAYTRMELDKLGLDKVWLQEVMVPKWVRGEKETAYFIEGKIKVSLSVCALGNSVATPAKGILANIIEVHGIDDLKALGTDKLKGKIVFFNRPMDPTKVETMEAYGGAVDQRSYGVLEAVKYGAIAVVVRSVNLRLDDYPHTGSLWYGDLPKEKQLPGAAISTIAAEKLSAALKKNPGLKFYLHQSCMRYEDVPSYNVIGEITGSENPNRFMVVGGHLDSWDLAQGAQDDGTGVVQSMGVLELFKKIGYKPKNSLRVVLFMNEENGLRGGKKYAEEAKSKNETHIFAMESDSGGFSPNGFSFECPDADFDTALKWKPLFAPYMADSFTKGHAGSDIGPLQPESMFKVGLKPDSQRYFDYHHAATDRFEAVDKREMELGIAAMASLIYLFDNKK